ncbi:DUF6676 family protein [Corynebacterium lowii]|uniref:Uncharacterized protein n=1 Tax=Corynebacterium lowii TaxID=1544413 RepID=A0A0Q1DZU9_9CORY|nr:DUF6676 family protein [Corynebacterium lowii]KQB85775.1 hypothetical protein Clow_01909 [Corynebacterium lowii]MDP9851077.1 hypothetical protein [Corynebacterium lowii]
MIPDRLDLTALSAELSKDGVAVKSGTTDAQYRDLVAAIDAAEATGKGTFGVAILDFTPKDTSDLRDVAQELHDSTEIDTILVRSPQSGAVVSSIYPRNDLERAQQDFLTTSNYATAIREYPQHLDSSSIPWVPTSLSLLLLCIVLPLSGYARVKRENLTARQRHAHRPIM